MMTIDYSSLAIGDLIGDGGEGLVYQLPSHPQHVYKEFKSKISHELDEQGLQRTIDLIGTLPPSDRQLVVERTVWPSAIVRKGANFAGFLMPLVAGGYFCSHGRRGDPVRGLNDWNKLTFRRDWINNSNLQSDVPALWYANGVDTASLDDHAKESKLKLTQLLLDLATVFEVFHRHSICVGDVSGRNILWARDVANRVVIIDCDGIRTEGTRGVSRAKQSPDWIDPHLVGETNIASDQYKLALAIYRGYFSDGLGTPSMMKFPPRSDSERAIHDAALKGTGSNSRTTASEWVTILRSLESEIRNDGRPEIDWRTQPTSPVRTPIKNPDAVDDQPRPTVTW